MKKFSKLLTVLSALALSAALTFGAVACSGNKDDKKSQAPSTSAQDVYATSALSGASYLSASGASSVGKASAAVNSASIEINAPVFNFEGVAPKIKDGLELVDSLLAGNVSEKIEINTEKDGEFAAYTYLMTVTVDGKEVARMYFNETSTKTETEQDDDDDESKAETEQDDDDYESKTETSTTLEGVIVKGDKKFEVVGKKELEVEGDEKEFSVEFRTKADENNYVEFSYESEKDENSLETSYTVKIVRNGKVLQETELEYETENGKTEVELSFKAFKGIKFKVSKDDVNDNVFRLSYIIGESSFNVTVTKTETGYKFTIDGNHQFELPYSDAQ